jgi:hypothetical protein
MVLTGLDQRCRLFATLTSTRPGGWVLQVFQASKFQSKYEHKAVRANLKAADGLLYPLEKAFLFVAKPTLYIPYKDTEAVEFERLGGTQSKETVDLFSSTMAAGGGLTPGWVPGVTRNFDMRITMKAGDESRKERDLLFGQIDNAEYPGLVKFLKVRVHTRGVRDWPGDGRGSA